jgi:hypothetical protein
MSTAQSMVVANPTFSQERRELWRTLGLGLANRTLAI